MSRRNGGPEPGGNNGRRGQRPVLITGGAGFIGTNLAMRLLAAGQRVLIYDNFSRPGVDENVRGLLAHWPTLLDVEVADVRDGKRLRQAARHAAQVYHFAAQVAVTSSVIDPVFDFEVNARGTLTLLEALRELSDPPPLLFTSTNKVYGNLEDLALTERETRYEPTGQRRRTINEQRQLSLHSPYGCSKGAAEQYVLDYARSYGLPNVVFRMSCIYGPHQCGCEDQGWVAHFLISTIEERPLTIYGDGKQVRDILFIDDLTDAMIRALGSIEKTRGRAFNIGGGAASTISLIELVERITALHGERPRVRFGEWRIGDQRYYVSDCRAFESTTNWKRQVTVGDGIARLYNWLLDRPTGAHASDLPGRTDRPLYSYG